MRCFVSVDLDNRLTGKVLALQKELEGLDTSLVKPQNMHFTLKFLGEVNVKTADEVCAQLEKIAAATKPFGAELEGIGLFPNDHFMRVVWIGAPGLYNLQAAVNSAFGGGEAVPHLTLARIRSQKHRAEIRQFAERHRHEKVWTMHVDRMALKKSTLTRDGSIYEDVKIFELTG